MIFLVVISVSAAGLDERQKTDTSSKERFTVATYNINWGNPNLKEVEKAIRQSQANLVCLQETNIKSRQYLKRRLKRLYPHMTFRDGRWAEGFGFLSKTPILKLKYLPSRKGHFGTWVANVKLNGKIVQVANLHLQPMLPPRRGKITLKQYWEVYRKSEAVRSGEIVDIMSKLSKKLPVLIIGDLNSLSCMFVPQFLKKRGFVDAFASVTPNADNHITWRWKYKGVHWKYRLDYIFHQKQMQTVTSKVIKSKGSDHYLVTAAITWKKPKS